MLNAPVCLGHQSSEVGVDALLALADALLGLRQVAADLAQAIAHALVQVQITGLVAVEGERRWRRRGKR
jgi:hypothetical protein